MILEMILKNGHLLLKKKSNFAINCEIGKTIMYTKKFQMKDTVQAIRNITC